MYNYKIIRLEEKMAAYSSGVLINIPNPTPQDIKNLPKFTSSNIEEIAHVSIWSYII
jgi:hypothetical protein